MPPLRPPDYRRRKQPKIFLGTLFLALLLFSNVPLLASAQQKQLQHDEPYTAVPRGKSTFWGKDEGSSEALARGSDSAPKNDVRALATLAPTGQVPARRDLLAARSSGPTGGLASRLSARSLQDWKVEDLVLLATVDGSIHARDRKTGAPRWIMESEQPMVETVYHPRNKSLAGSGAGAGPEDFMWIVEPSRGGSLYGYMPQTSFGMQRLNLTVQQLADEWSPYESTEPPLVYVGEKKTTVYTVDVSNGKVLKLFSSSGTAILDDNSCRTVNDLEALEDNECDITGTISLGRSEYKVDISSPTTGEAICTIRYFEWGPNNRDRDLIKQYANSKDNRYIYSRFDGSVIAQDYLSSSPSGEPTDPQPLYRSKFPSPVVRVFDLARQRNDQSNDPSLVILPQPIAPASSDEILYADQVFVNCTSSGSWFALSEIQYPHVTDGAESAPCTADGWQELASRIDDEDRSILKKGLVGVHGLHAGKDIPRDASHVPLIGAPPEPPAISPPQDVVVDQAKHGGLTNLSTNQPLFWLMLAFSLVLGYVVPKHGLKLSSKLPTGLQLQSPANESSQSLRNPEIVVEDSSTPAADKPLADATPQPIKMDTLRTDSGDTITVPVFDATVPMGKSASPERGDLEATLGKKKKAHRGKRGGRKERDKKEAGEEGTAEEDKQKVALVDGVQQDGEDTVVKPDAVSKAVAEESPTKGLDNLRIHTDRVLGNGSGGTFVFEGEFENRLVAVKRMLPQYYELASQEVSLLEHSEEHPHVIRYFCRREDEHFLYIALELCQASLWDLFRDGRHDEAPDPRFSALSQQILSDPRRVLRQMAEGIKYLHNFRIVHRDIKPQNMLIAFPKKNSMSNFPRLVISDFGLCKTLPENVSTLIGTTGHAGTAGWKAPELILQPKEMSSSSQNSTARSETGSENPSGGAMGVKRALDIFSLGCVFFYVLTGGQHPFDDDEGWMQLRERNIKIGRMNIGPLELLGPDVVDLVQWMLAHKPEERPTASQVLAHPFFWDSEDRLEFLSVASDRFDQEPRDGTSLVLQEVESHAAELIPASLVGSQAHISHAMHGHLRNNNNDGSLPNGVASTMHLPIKEPNFLSVLDKRFVETIGRQRKYDPSKLTDLLRALRNKYHHWDDMPDDVKTRVGEVPEGYLSYWEGKFPGLVVKVWRSVSALGINEERRFGRWFANKGN